ncbi:MAG TPA: CPBP family intramembrane glutamic endopeptidase, partial [Clostridia bacterium]|nr:CPBP family intramembrane glutamic endopeptidase [Clostridia bacterium]
IYILFKNAGVTLPYEDVVPPLEVTAVVLLFIKTAVAPALIEEFAVRGFLLQSMRRLGDGFAIVMSSLVFSLLHANAVQIPFAFMAGLVLGYVFCKTNSIWTSIIVHFLNNAFSCVETVIFAALPENTAQNVDTILTIIIAVTALLSLVIVLISKKSSLPKIHTYLSNAEKAKAFIYQPLFFVMALLFLGFTLLDVFNANV